MSGVESVDEEECPISNAAGHSTDTATGDGSTLSDGMGILDPVSSGVENSDGRNMEDALVNDTLDSAGSTEGTPVGNTLDSAGSTEDTPTGSTMDSARSAEDTPTGSTLDSTGSTGDTPVGDAQDSAGDTEDTPASDAQSQAKSPKGAHIRDEENQARDVQNKGNPVKGARDTATSKLRPTAFW